MNQSVYNKLVELAQKACEALERNFNIHVKPVTLKPSSGPIKDRQYLSFYLSVYNKAFGDDPANLNNSKCGCWLGGDGNHIISFNEKGEVELLDGYRGQTKKYKWPELKAQLKNFSQEDRNILIVAHMIYHFLKKQEDRKDGTLKIF